VWVDRQVHRAAGYGERGPTAICLAQPRNAAGSLSAERCFTTANIVSWRASSPRSSAGATDPPEIGQQVPHDGVERRRVASLHAGPRLRRASTHSLERRPSAKGSVGQRPEGTLEATWRPPSRGPPSRARHPRDASCGGRAALPTVYRRWRTRSRSPSGRPTSQCGMNVLRLWCAFTARWPSASGSGGCRCRRSA
jgi:hypothetical protein